MINYHGHVVWWQLLGLLSWYPIMYFRQLISRSALRTWNLRVPDLWLWLDFMIGYQKSGCYNGYQDDTPCCNFRILRGNGTSCSGGPWRNFVLVYYLAFEVFETYMIIGCPRMKSAPMWSFTVNSLAPNGRNFTVDILKALCWKVLYFDSNFATVCF